jgi:hypothetical protein
VSMTSRVAREKKPQCKACDKMTNNSFGMNLSFGAGLEWHNRYSRYFHGKLTSCSRCEDGMMTVLSALP